MTNILAAAVVTIFSLFNAHNVAGILPKYLRQNRTYNAIPPSSFGIFQSLWDIFDVLKDIMPPTIVSPVNFEVRSVILFLSAKGVKPINIHHEICEVYGQNIMRDGMPEIMNLPPVYDLYDKMRQDQIVHLPPRGRRKPFIVIEGVRGSGKSALSVQFASNMNATYLRAPPEYFAPFKPWMKTRNKMERNAFHALSNYLLAEQTKYILESQMVVMDLYWHGLTSYELARLSGRAGVLPLPSSPIYRWPTDLLVPDIAFYVMVTDDGRYYREKATNLPAVSKKLREAMFKAYSRFYRPRMVHINGDRLRVDVEAELRNITCRLLQGLL